MTLHRLRLDRAGWQAHRSTDVEITGLADCLADFGLPAKTPLDASRLGRPTCPSGRGTLAKRRLTSGVPR